MGNKIKVILTYIMYFVLGTIAHTSLKDIAFYGENRVFSYLLTVFLVNIIAIVITKKFIINHTHLLVLIGLNLLLAARAMVTNNYLLWVTPAFWFIISCLVYYKEQQKLKP